MPTLPIITYVKLAAAALLIAVIGWLLYSKSELETTVEKQKVTITQMIDVNASFKDASDLQNGNILNLQLENNNRKLFADAALKSAGAKVQLDQEMIDRINSMPMIGNDCENANRLFVKYLQGQFTPRRIAP